MMYNIATDVDYRSNNNLLLKAMLDLPRILLIFELCMSGQALRIDLRSSLAQTMNAFIGRFMCGLLGSCFSLGDRIIFAKK